MTGQPAVPVPAATLMLLRDGPQGLEVLMMVRHEASGFAGGALVFPGGKVAHADRVVAERLAGDEWRLILKLAAIRETFEECGILLARKEGAATVLSPAELAGLEPSADFAELLAARNIQPATDLLVHFANWITPVFSPKRFDTHFFVADLACAQSARQDGREAADVLWTTPAAAIAAAEEGRRLLLPPTRLNLLKLGASATVEAALAAARQAVIVPVTPELVRTQAGPELVIPEAAGYGVSRVPAVGLPGR